MAKKTATNTHKSNTLPDSGFVKLDSIIGNEKKGIAPLIPVCRRTWFNGVKSGRFPSPVKLCGTRNSWHVDVIRKLIADLNAEALA